MWNEPRTAADRNKRRTINKIILKEGYDWESTQEQLSNLIYGNDVPESCSWSDVSNSHIVAFEDSLKIQTASLLQDSLLTEEDEKTSPQTIQTEQLERKKSRSSDNLEAEDEVRLSGQSKESMGSNALVNASRTRDILLAHNSSVEIVQQDTGTGTSYKLRPNVEFYFNKGQRGKTYLPGNSQGNHISSYISILTAFVHSIANESGIDQAIDRFKNVGLTLLSDDEEISRNILKRKIHSSLLPDGRDAALRHIPEEETTKVLNEGGEMVDVPLKLMVKKGLIYERIDEKAKLLDGLGNYVLRKIQENKDFTVYSRGRIDARKDEGAVAKDSIRGLIFLDKVCLLNNIIGDQNFEEELAPFLRSLEADSRKTSATTSERADEEAVEEGQDAHLMRYGMNAWFEDGGTKADGLINTLISSGSVQAKREILKQVIEDMMAKNHQDKSISGFIGGLFDYDRELVFDYKKAFPLTKTELEDIDKRLKSEVEKGVLRSDQVDRQRLIEAGAVVQSKIAEQFEMEFSEVDVQTRLTYDEKHKISGQIVLSRSDQEKLEKITTKHLDIMDVVCKNALSHPIVENIYSSAKSEFVDQSVLKDGGWNKLEGFAERAFKIRINQQIDNARTLGGRS